LRGDLIACAHEQGVICRAESPTAGLAVGLVRQEERARWRELMRQHHYLGLPHIGGESLFYVATSKDEWVALIGWGAAALKCGVPDHWIGWEQAAQVFAIQRETTEMVAQKFRCEIVYGITGMTAGRANPERILAFSRTHSAIPTQTTLWFLGANLRHHERNLFSTMR
jgi:hypothetical protein